jgi:hypothetical protein
VSWQEEAQDLKFNKGKSWMETAKAVQHYFPDMSLHDVWEKVRCALRRTDTYKTRGKVTFEDRKEPTVQDIDNYFQQLIQINDAVLALETKQTKATVCIDESKPVGIAFWGDWHIGGKGIDYRQLDADANTISATDGLYVIGMGDYKDNASALVHQSSTQESIATTDMQDKMVFRIFERTKDKHIVTLRGCHEQWDKRNANKDYVQALCDITGAVNLWHGGIVNLTVGEQEYRIGARHKFKFESSLNTTNAQRNFMIEFGPCDTVAIAHKHFCEVHDSHKMKQDTVYLRSGAYKRYDEFGQQLAGYEGMYGVPIVIYWPDKHLMLPFRDFQTGLEMLRAVRK